MAIDLRRELRKALDQRIREQEDMTHALDQCTIECAQVRLRHAAAARKAIEDRDVFEAVKRTGIGLWRRAHGSTLDPTTFSPGTRLAVLENGVEAYVAVHGLAD